ncbi:hypothetical protein FRC0095_01473 [Corynebacterium diphtheriae]|nr:hypothetical protein CIP107524_01467 [Corynebacterium diphtheriae]CAB0727201.1 hypothetical protein FRC0087_01375 [Corynebacterium diphtheriae]CAB0737174.1 hypothetical protein FRC0095_01473 [Corynebacterium diphtheriae]CAB0785518.1 hypothetical protein FRC0195_00186 [Corynebacterium diphtheriae]CAB0803269.1 hypothetical protein FRC0201_01411 [Corynebacterium diphtheriae]
MESLTASVMNFILGGGLVALIGLLGTKATAKAQKESAEISAKGPEWQAYVDEMKDWTSKQLKERDDMIARLQDQLNQIQEKLDLWRTRYYAAVHYIRELHLAYSGAREKYPVPDELEQDF